jgi:hypothetical protein
MAAYVVTAVFCERLLNEKDGTASLVRIIDRVHHEATAIDTATRVESTSSEALAAVEGAPFLHQMVFYVSLWVDAPGTHQVDVTIAYEDGPRFEVASAGIEFSEPRQGRNMAVNIDGFPRPGDLWADVAIDGVLKTRTPLTLRRELGTLAQ